MNDVGVNKSQRNLWETQTMRYSLDAQRKF